MQQDFAKGFFDVAMTAEPKPKTVAIAGLDSDFLQRSMHSARIQAAAQGLQIVYDKSYPTGTVDYSPIVRAIQAAKPDIVYFASYPGDSVGLLKAVYEAKLIGDRARRRHDRTASHGDQGAVRGQAQQPPVLGRLCARADAEICRRRGLPRALSRRGGEGESRSLSAFTRRRSPIRRCS